MLLDKISQLIEHVQRGVSLTVGFSNFFVYLINHYLYSDYLAYDERPHLHVGCLTPALVPVPGFQQLCVQLH